MKKLLSLALITVMLLGALPITAAADDVTINVYNWGQYISDGTDGYIDVNKAFTEATGIKVNYMTYDTNESLYTKLKTGGSTYDVIIPSDYMIARLIDEGMLETIDFDKIPNYQYIDSAYKSTAYDPDNQYSVPYTWGTVGVIYNKNYVDEADIGSWDLLWNEKYSGKILMFDNPRDAFAIAESLLGYDMNTENEDELKAAAEKLKEQKPLVQSYVMDQIYDKMIRGEAYIAPYYAGDYLWMLDENPDLGFYFPKEGFNIFIDAMCIPTSCQNKEAAETYINFLCSPEISGQNLDYLGYSTPISEAKQYMDESMAASDIAYPDSTTLARATNFLNLQPETSQLMDSLWLEVKTQSSENHSSTVVIAAVAGILAFLITLLLVRKTRRGKRHGRGKNK
ncbi:MAG: PotD/PotF family extracellular solute-binding protein [Oscillospiraceae bacterium]